MTAAARQDAAPKPAGDPRRGLIAKIHVAKKQLALTEESYRDRLRRVTGKDSAKACSIAQLEAVVADFVNLGFDAKKAKPKPKRAGALPMAEGPLAAKVRALWISLWQLGVVDNPSEEALTSFVAGQTKGRTLHGQGVQRLHWLRAEESDAVIEALKAWAARSPAKGGGGVDWSAHRNPRRCVVEAQWRRLLALDAIVRPEWVDAESYGYKATGKAGYQFYEDRDWDRLIGALGKTLHRALAAARAEGEA